MSMLPRMKNDRFEIDMTIRVTVDPVRVGFDMSEEDLATLLTEKIGQIEIIDHAELRDRY